MYYDPYNFVFCEYTHIIYNLLQKCMDYLRDGVRLSTLEDDQDPHNLISHANVFLPSNDFYSYLQIKHHELDSSIMKNLCGQTFKPPSLLFYELYSSARVSLV